MINRTLQLLSALLVYALFLPLSSHAQLDTVHFIPPVGHCHSSPNQGALYISTPSINPVNYSIRDGAGNLLQAGTVSNAAAAIYRLNGNNPDFFVPTGLLDSVLSDKGFIIQADEPIYANLRYQVVGNNQSLSITAKGTKAFGTSFRVAHVRSLPDNISYATMTVMGTENNTNVVVDLTGTGITLFGPNAPDANANVLAFNLNRGETYTFAANALANGTPPMDSILGRLITSNRPVVTVMGNWLASWASGNWDVGFDQPVAENLLGTQYVLLQGAGSNDKEKAIVIGNQNNTEIFLNGSAIPFATLDAGEFAEIPGSFYNADSVMFIQTSQPAYVWQVMFGRNSWANWGLNFLPPVSCLTERFVDFIPNLNLVDTISYTGNINLITYGGSTVTFNGGPVPVAPVNVPGSSFQAYRVHGLTGNIRVQSSSIAVVGMYGYRGPSSYGGYFSGFDSIPEIVAPITGGNCPDTLFVDNTFDSYQWMVNGVVDPAATDTFFALNGATGAFNVIVSKGVCEDTSGTFTINCILPVALAYWEGECSPVREVKWGTWQEENADWFAVEGTENGAEWTEWGRVKATGNSALLREYRLSLPAEAHVHSNFRLRQIDVDGQQHVSAVLRMDCGAERWVEVVPHPAQGDVRVQFSGLSGVVAVRVFGVDGREIHHGAVDGATGEFRMELPRGLYVLQLQDQQGVLRRQLVVQ